MPISDLVFISARQRKAFGDDPWIVMKVSNEPERWVAGPREKGVYITLYPPTKWRLFDSLIEAGDWARAQVVEQLRNAQHAMNGTTR